jgi:hypothetical protein
VPSRRPTLVALFIATAFLAASGGSAGAARLIGSRDVVDNSLKSIDIKNDTLRGKDIHNGALTARDFSGPPPAGATPNATYTWTINFTENGDDGGGPGGTRQPLLTSNTKMPAGAHLQGVDIEATGDFTRCSAGGADLSVAPASVDAWAGGGGLGGAQFYGDVTTARALTLGDAQLRPDGPTKLAVSVCYDEQSNELALPSFTLTLTFTLTKLNNPPATEFN